MPGCPARTLQGRAALPVLRSRRLPQRHVSAVGARSGGPRGGQAVAKNNAYTEYIPARMQGNIEPGPS